MGWFSRVFIAVPDDHKSQLVYKWPDVNIRRHSQVIVNADQCAIFVKTGHIIAVMEPGRHRIDADELPVLGALTDTLTGGNYYRAELYFVSKLTTTEIKFGGLLANIEDPVSEQVVSLRVFGNFALGAHDPVMVVTHCVGTVDFTDPTRLHRWCGDLLLKSIKVNVTEGIIGGRWPLLGLSAKTKAIEDIVVPHANLTLKQFGMKITRMGNFDICLAPEDEERLKRLAKDKTYMRLAGDFREYTAGELSLGAAEGFTRGRGIGDGMLGSALGLYAISGIRSGFTTTITHTICTVCGTTNSKSDRFCWNCGTQLRSSQRGHCSECHMELSGSAKFCGQCGTPVADSARGSVPD